ncbi:Ig-like domain-containing protein [Exiguobacterium flavidum]|uniref:Ig-like domain-containing protein n=1 Tax=Exiguobacterium flavidum TaxID=2184695 RepID=UPI000DF7AB9D|nr:Ig-like domain-containing protein [Exiguobacterium flavidum]
MKKMKLWLRHSIALVLAIGVLSGTGTTAEAENPELLLGKTTKGTLTASQPVRYYQFKLERAGRLTLDVKSSVEKWARFELYDSFNKKAMTVEPRGTASMPGREVVWRDLEAGSYTLKVSESDGETSVGSFEVATTFLPANNEEKEPNDGTAIAHPLAIGKSIKGLLTWQDGRDMYAVDLTRAGRLSLDVSSAIDPRAFIGLNDSYNTRIWYAYFAGNSSNPDRKLFAVDLEPGRYYIEIETWSDKHSGSYQLKTAFTPAYNTESEPNNGPAEAQVLPFSKRLTGFISWNDSADVYQIVVPKASTIGIDLNSNIRSYASIELIDDMNNSLFKDYAQTISTTGRLKKMVTLPKGTYYLKVGEYGTTNGRTGKYQLTVTSSHLLPALSVNTVLRSSTKVSGKTEKSASVTLTCDQKSYTRKADANGNYSFAIKRQKAGALLKVTAKNKYGAITKTIRAK